MSKHTPGPWVVDGDVIRGDQQRNGSISVASMLDVSYPYGRRAGESKHANAHLLAAAPELLEFAQEVRRTGDTRLASMAIAAIAKATGEHHDN